MKSSNRLIVASALMLAALGSVSRAGYAQDAPAPAAVDSNALYAGDWDFTIQLRDSTIGGGWRLNYVQGRFSGIVARPGVPPSPVKEFTVRENSKRDMRLVVDWNGEEYVFTGRLENVRNITGTVSYRGGIGRLRAQKRS
jgi:hypothetical protein